MIPGPSMIVAIAGLALARWYLRRRRGRRTLVDHAADALPRALDLCTVVLGAGGSIRDCVVALADYGPPPVAATATAMLERTAVGQRFDMSLRWFRAELGPRFQPLTGALLLANEQGGSVADLLARLAAEASAGRRRQGEERARRLPVALLIPLVVCSLPAVVIGAVVPLALVAIDHLDF